MLRRANPRPPPQHLSPEKAEAEARANYRNVRESWEELRQIIARHATTIEKRWLKKTKGKRIQMLLEAWPDMPEVHRPDLNAFMEGQRSLRLAPEAWFYWPSINQEDLSRPKLLPLLLQSRAQSDPIAFCVVDTDTHRFGVATDKIQYPACDGYVMEFVNHSPSTGNVDIIPIKELLRRSDRPSEHHIFPAGEGLSALRAQQRLYEFLVSICRRILHDIPASDVLHYPVKAEWFHASHDTPALASVAATIGEARDKRPATLDLDGVERLMAEKLAAAEDHLWALREDPGYFASNIEDVKAHTTAQSLSLRKIRQSKLGETERTTWTKVVSKCVCHALVMIQNWDLLLDQVADARELYVTSTLDAGTPFPKDYSQALCRLCYSLIVFANRLCEDVTIELLYSPPFRRLIDMREDAGSRIHVSLKKDFPADSSGGRLLWMMTRLLRDLDVNWIGLGNIMDELARIQEQDPKLKDFISPRVANGLSDLTVVSTCLRQIQDHYPRPAMFESALLLNLKELVKEYRETISSVEIHYMTAVRESPISPCELVEQPSDGIFDYPAGKKRTRDVVDRMRRAEATLDRFWGELNVQLESEKVFTLRLEALLRSRTPLRTPEYTEPVKVPKSTETSLNTSLSELYLDLEERTERTVVRESSTPGKVKTKTRREKAPPAPPPGAAAAVEPPAEVVPHSPSTVFRVDKRAIKVFRALFFSRSTSSQPGEIEWLDFVHAMCSMNFQAKHTEGSSWLFTPLWPGAKRSISFHQPHPSNKFSYRDARKHGRRLTLAYQWHGGMFDEE
ncbi:hypothetical protein NA57DRAFT_46616 [Rhizodiscina lignyota]|uniref:Uncharacterized protein n=1 Tax=Rhizodiscina lignyota TaxID=1504668 RepID=A0A9P4I3Z6_9PEZI|nr:hypothetical protein NA57DRAFT_46616 [Rhizodiscina lignyota]